MPPLGGALAGDANSSEAAKTVRERSHPHLQPHGLFYGSLSIYPSIEAAGVYDSNVFASPDFAVDDRIYILSPEVRVLKESGVFSHEFRVNAEHFEYERFQSQNRTSAGALFKSTWDVDDSAQLQTSFGAASAFESREDSLTSTDSVLPIGYRDLNAEVSVAKQFGDFGATLGGGVRHLSYDDGETDSGAIIDQSFRDGAILTANFKPFYDLSPDYRVYMQFAANQRDFEGEGELNRDSEGFTSSAGVEFKLTPLLFGSADAGYLQQEYDNPSIPAASGQSLSANVSWLMTPLITVSAFASRRVADTASFDENGRLDSLVGLQLDYEVRRNLIVSSVYSYKEEEFNGSPRSDKLQKLSSELLYYFNSSIFFKLGYNYFERNSNFDEFAFAKHSILASVSARY